MSITESLRALMMGLAMFPFSPATAEAERAEANDSEAANGFVSKLKTTSYINLAIGVED